MSGDNWTEEELAAYLGRLVGMKQANDPDVGPTEKPPRRHKYGVAPKAERTVGLLTFASKAEAEAYQKILLLMQAGEVTDLQLQPKFKFPMGFEYWADFRVTWKDGSLEFIDAKGLETPVFKLKKKCMDYFYPNVKLSLWKRD